MKSITSLLLTALVGVSFIGCQSMKSDSSMKKCPKNSKTCPAEKKACCKKK